MIELFHTRDGPIFPSLHLLQRFPSMMPALRVDNGAIKFVFSGANIMCPGLTSNGATLHDSVDAGSPVAIFAQGKEHPLAVGTTSMSTSEMVSLNKGIAVEIAHHINDGLWLANSTKVPSSQRC